MIKGIQLNTYNYTTKLGHIIVPIPFWQQTIENVIKFEILTSSLGFLILNFFASNGYSK